jgi:hypothetical protein
VSPGSFDYWVQVSRSAGSSSAVIPQSITTGNFSTLFGLGTGTAVYNAGCVAVSGATAAAASGNSSFTVSWNAANSGTYYIALTLSTSTVNNKRAPSSAVHYQYSTNGVTGSTSGIDLIP